MKYLIYIIFLSTYLYMGCDTIEPFEDGTYITKPDVVEGDTIPHIILFEFTGWNCPNCPDGHEMVNILENTYHESVQAIAIHDGVLATPGNDNYYDFRTEVGNQLFKKFGSPNAIPAGSVNSMSSDNLSTSVDQWATDFSVVYSSAIENSELYLIFDYSVDQNKIKTNVTVEFAKDIQGEFNLSAYVVENGMVDLQNVYGVIDESYIHNHALRASMYNGAIGEFLATNPKAGTKFAKNYSLDIDPDWIADSLQVIPFVYNTQTNQVLSTVVINPKNE